MFKEAFPENFGAYAETCKRKEIEVGHMFVTENLTFAGPSTFPSKKHWRRPSQLEWIVDALKDLRRVVEEKEIRSIAVPALGCGNGGLDWNDVRPEIEHALAPLYNVDVLVFEPTPTIGSSPRVPPLNAKGHIPRT